MKQGMCVTEKTIYLNKKTTNIFIKLNRIGLKAI